MKVAKKSIKDSLQEFFGFDSFKGEQEEIINNVLIGNDSFVIMPTGGRKIPLLPIARSDDAGHRHHHFPAYRFNDTQCDQKACEA